jgi:hypothetical protein
MRFEGEKNSISRLIKYLLAYFGFYKIRQLTHYERCSLMLVHEKCLDNYYEVFLEAANKLQCNIASVKYYYYPCRFPVSLKKNNNLVIWTDRQILSQVMLRHIDLKRYSIIQHGVIIGNEHNPLVRDEWIGTGAECIYCWCEKTKEIINNTSIDNIKTISLNLNVLQSARKVIDGTGFFSRGIEHIASDLILFNSFSEKCSIDLIYFHPSYSILNKLYFLLVVRRYVKYGTSLTITKEVITMSHSIVLLANQCGSNMVGFVNE